MKSLTLKRKLILFSIFCLVLLICITWRIGVHETDRDAVFGFMVISLLFIGIYFEQKFKYPKLNYILMFSVAYVPLLAVFHEYFDLVIAIMLSLLISSFIALSFYGVEEKRNRIAEVVLVRLMLAIMSLFMLPFIYGIALVVAHLLGGAIISYFPTTFAADDFTLIHYITSIMVFIIAVLLQENAYKIEKRFLKQKLEDPEHSMMYSFILCALSFNYKKIISFFYLLILIYNQLSKMGVIIPLPANLIEYVSVNEYAIIVFFAIDRILTLSKKENDAKLFRTLLYNDMLDYRNAKYVGFSTYDKD